MEGSLYHHRKGISTHTHAEFANDRWQIGHAEGTYSGDKLANGDTGVTKQQPKKNKVTKLMKIQCWRRQRTKLSRVTQYYVIRRHNSSITPFLLLTDERELLTQIQCNCPFWNFPLTSTTTREVVNYFSPFLSDVSAFFPEKTGSFGSQGV